MKIQFVFLLTLLISSLATMQAQEPRVIRMQAPMQAGSRIDSPGGTATFPFELISNHIMLPVEIRGTVVKLILDTGMPIEGAILFGSEVIDGLNLTYMGKAPIMGAGGSTVESDLAIGIDFKLPGVSFSGQMVMVMPYEAGRNKHHEGKDGIIGSSLFKHFVVSVDYDRMEITLTDPEQFRYTGKGAKIPLEIAQYPMVTGETEMESGKKVPVDLVVDTGNFDALTLNVGSADAIVLPDKNIEIYKVSLQKEIPSRLGRIKGFRIGGFLFEDVLCNFAEKSPPPWEKEGNLGQEILKRFNVTFDFSRQEMFLEPNGRFADPFDFNRAGILFIRTEEGLLRITRVVLDSPASGAGLKKGDLLNSIDGRPVTEITRDEAYRLLQGDIGQEVTLEALRDGSEFKAVISLRRLI